MSTHLAFWTTTRNIQTWFRPVVATDNIYPDSGIDG